MIRLLIVGRQLGVREGLRMRLAAEPDFAVVGETVDSETALNLAAVLQPDVVLVDIDTSQLHGLALSMALWALCPQFAVIILSFQDDACTRRIAADMGAAAFVVKSLPAGTLLTTIRQIACQRGSGSTIHDVPPRV